MSSRRRRLALLILLVFVLATGPARSESVRWEQWLHLSRVVDVGGPRSDGSMVASAGGRLYLVRPDRSVRPFAPSYKTNAGTEPYLVVTNGVGCFPRDDTYALDLNKPLGLIRIDASGAVSRFAEIGGVEFMSGIAFDNVGTFGRRLLVTGTHAGKTVVDAVDCRGAVTRITDNAQAVEGGIAVAPPTFGTYAGQLIGADERTGRIVAFRADGATAIIAASGLPAGGDIGVESAGFVPLGFVHGTGAAYLADRSSPGSPTKGTDTLLRFRAAVLRAAGVRDGDLLVATEAAGRTIAVRCTVQCTVTKIGQATDAAHPEGHLLFVDGSPALRQTRWSRTVALVGAIVVIVLASALLVTWRTRRRA